MIGLPDELAFCLEPAYLGIKALPFLYYKKLSARDKAIYRKSDAVRSIPLHIDRHLQHLASELEAALNTEGVQQRKRVESSSQALSDALCKQLKVQRVAVQVLAKRPSSSTSELHGLYTREEGKQAQIQVWRKTAALRKTVKFKTFLRTLVHELCHHFDYELLKLADSFHTEGFFARESSIVKQLTQKLESSQTAKITRKETDTDPSLASNPVDQLMLFFS